MTGDPRSDGELIAGLPRQPELMGVLYERHAPAMFHYLARRAGPPAAEDLLSEVFIAALSASSRVVAHQSGSALPWLYGIGLNVLFLSANATNTEPHVNQPKPFLSPGTAQPSGSVSAATRERIWSRPGHPPTAPRADRRSTPPGTSSSRPPRCQ